MDPPPPYTPLPDITETSPNSLRYPPPPPLQTPPQLPPRSPYNHLSPQPSSSASSAGHARSASQTSIVPVADVMKRKLLVIYIHGFMGNETSFQSFPAHLHNLLCVTLDPLGYLVHTKVYPKFKTRYNILVATENFSQWLSQFENDSTDVVLIGHSMGGLLAADVALLQDYTGRRRHRLLGTISFDTPFLGMHPGVISAGLGSIFRPAPKSPGEEGIYQDGGEAPSQSTVSLHTMNSGGSHVDEFYSKKPTRNFTVVVPKTEGTWSSTLHFITKHHSRLTQATGQYLMSHLEFGGCLADPIGLKNRYTAIRALEDGVRNPNGWVDRVRFVNYYTSSTGRDKTGTTRAIEQGPGGEVSIIPGPELHDDLVGVGEGSLSGNMDTELGVSQVGSSSGHTRSLSESSYNTAGSMGDMKHIPAEPFTDDEYEGEPVALHIVETDEVPIADGRPPTKLTTNEKFLLEDTINEKEYNEKGCSKGPASHQSPDITRQLTNDTDSTFNEKISLSPEDSHLPQMPPPPEEPPTFDYSQIPDATVRKAAEKEAAKVRKRYDKAVKDYEKAIRDQEKELEKAARDREKELEKAIRDREKELGKVNKHKGKEIDRGTKEEEKRKEREERERRRECKDREKDLERAERDRLREMRDWEREKEKEGRDLEREREKKERDIQRELERKKRESKEDRRRSHCGGESTQEEQELERLRKEQERMDAEYRRMNGIPEPPPLSPRQAPASITPSPSSSRSHLPIPPAATRCTPPQQPKQKKKRERRFCILPRDKSDKCWVKVEMTGVDEVGAHCGLFFVGEVYERLVGDVAAKIEDWVGEEGSRRVVEEEGEGMTKESKNI